MILSESEVKALCTALTQGQGTFTTDDAVCVVEWAREIVISYHALQLVLRGRIGLTVKEDEVLFLPLGIEVND